MIIWREEKFCRLNVFKIIRKDYQKAIDTVIPKNIYLEIKFEKAITFLKYNNIISTKRIDTYHAVYALSRSLSLGHIVHMIIVILSWMCTDNGISAVYIAIDIMMAILFFERAYRYFYSWIKNIFIQYYNSNDSLLKN